MACKASRDKHGTTYTIPDSKPGRSPGGDVFAGSASVDVWWSRDLKARANETLIIKQENKADVSDVLQLTLAQVYDLHHALGCAILAA